MTLKRARGTSWGGGGRNYPQDKREETCDLNQDGRLRGPPLKNLFISERTTTTDYEKKQGLQGG